MAKRTQVVLIDDLDGSPAAESVSFAIDGVTYEVDLSADNAARLRESLAAYTAVGTRIGGRRRATRKRTGESNANEIRAWAQAQGLAVSARGRVPSDIRQAYENAH